MKGSKIGRSVKRAVITVISVLFFFMLIDQAVSIVYLTVQRNDYGEKATSLYKVRLTGNDLLIEADRDAYQSRLAISEMLDPSVYRNRSRLDEKIKFARENYTQANDRFGKFRALVEKSLYKNEREFQVFDQNYKNWVSYTEDIIGFIQGGKIESALSLYYGSYDNVFNPMREAMNGLTDKMLADSEKEYKIIQENMQASLIATLIMAFAFFALVVLAVIVVILLYGADDRKNYYESILDAVPLPITVTDMDMKWTFVNTAVEGMIGVKRETIYGQHCSNWKADICNTEKCGIEMLRKGHDHSDFVNKDSDHYYRTNVSYIKDRKKNNVGHIEIVTDIDSEMKIRQIADQVRKAVVQMESGTKQLSLASQTLSQGAAEQAGSMEEITSSITEINSQARQNLDNASNADKIARDMMSSAETGNRQIKELAESIMRINKSADGIKKMAKSIDDIAFQINLLALNANVEAARAGKYGKGFAVVAEEVRNLAVRSAKSVQEATALVDEAIRNITSGSSQAEAATSRMDAIVALATKVTSIAEEVVGASREQSTGLDQINIGLGQIDHVTQSNAANAEETASAAEELASQAAWLKDIVGRFGTEGLGEAVCEDDERPAAKPTSGLLK